MSKGYQKFGLLKLFLNAGDSLVSNTGSPAFLSFFLHTHTHLQSSLETFDICSSFILCQVLLAPWLSFIICTRIHVYTHVHICMHTHSLSNARKFIIQKSHDCILMTYIYLMLLSLPLL